MKTPTQWICVLFGLAVFGCGDANHTDASQPSPHQATPLEACRSLHIAGALDVTFQRRGSPSVVVYDPPAGSDGLELEIGREDALGSVKLSYTQATQRRRVTVTCPGLTELRLSGSARFDADDGLNANKIAAYGSSQCHVRGMSVDEVQLGVSGSAELHVKQLTAESVVLGSSGSSRVSLAGDTTSLELEGLGASHVDTSDLSVQRLSLVLRGNAQVDGRASAHVGGRMVGASRAAIMVRAATEIAVDADDAAKLEVRAN